MKYKKRDIKIGFNDGSEAYIPNTTADVGFVSWRQQRQHSNKTILKMDVKHKVDAIKDGTVIDHIPAGYGWKVYNFLREKIPEGTTLCLLEYVESKKLGEKDLIKLYDYKLPKNSLPDLYSIVDNKKPTISYIENWEIEEKIKE